MDEIRRMKTGREERGELVTVRMGSEVIKRRVLENKRKLKGKEIWIEEDLTFREKKMKWRLRRVAEEEERKGAVMIIGYGKLRIDGK